MSLEHTILKLIDKRKADVCSLIDKSNKGEVTYEEYTSLAAQYQQSINDLYMVLTCHDNPQSKFSVLSTKK